MPGPTKPSDALAWVKAAAADGRYVRSVHFEERLAQRNITMLDVLNAITKTTQVVSYPKGKARNGGTQWRVLGPDTDGNRTIVVGVETFLDHKKRRMMLVTVFDSDAEEE